MKEAGFNIFHLLTVFGVNEKKEFYDMIVNNNGEGVVAKHRMGVYRPVESRTKNTWVKIKRSVQQSLTSTDFNDTIDAFVTGFGVGTKGKGHEDYVGALHFSVWLVDKDGQRSKHEIARISSISLELRRAITCQDENGKPDLVDGMYGKVAEIDGQAVSARSKRLSHAVIVAWREDKNYDDCVMDKKFLESMVM
jgi:ATP-dependent DNA ligase